MTKKLKTIAGTAGKIIFLLFLPAMAICQLHADFSASPMVSCPPVVVNFKNASTGNPTSYSWDLGNGTISTSKDPVATYFDPGKYTIKLVIRDINGADSIIKTGFIVVNALPVPLFGVSDTLGCFPLTARFSDSSLGGTGNIASWQWDFGDGTLSNVQNPVHTFSDAGNYTVTLKLTNSAGCTNFIRKPSYIKLQDGVKANFSYSSVSGCHPPAPVTFNNLTNGTGAITYKWDFGDGNTSGIKNPVNNYQNGGVYTVQLVAITSYGCADTMIKNNAINIGFVKANFTIPATVCSGNATQLTNASNPASFIGSRWDFGDGTTSTDANPVKVYSASGDYQVKMVTDFGSCKDSVTKKITALPKPDGDFSGSNNKSCLPPLDVTFNSSANGAVSYQWIFGDGAVSGVQNPVHTYTTSGIFTVTLILTNASGCTDTIVKTDFVKIVPPKIVSIDSLPKSGCAPFTISPAVVMNDSTPVTNYFWDFGDGSTSTLAKPVHQYAQTGSFDVKIKIVSASGCSDTLTLVHGVNAGTRPSAQFSSDTLNLCASKSITFTDHSTGAVVDSWYWTFGDGTTSSDSMPIHKYTDTGYFNVSMVAYNNGCSDTITKNKYIFVQPPIAKFDTSFLCSNPLTRNFIDKSVDATSWQWSFGDSAVATGKKVAHTYATPGNYKVTLFVTNGTCSDTSKAQVVVLQIGAKLQASDSVSCVNTNVTFTVNNVDPNNVKLYTWYLNGIIKQPTVITGNNIVMTNYHSFGTYQPAAILQDILNCTDTLFTTVPIQVFGPKAGFGTTVPGICVGNSITFSDSSKTDGVHTINNYTWNFGDGNIQSFTSSPFAHRYDSAGIFDVSLSVTDGYGCRDSLFKPAFVTIAKPIASFSSSDTLVCPNAPVTFNNTTAGSGNTYSWNFGDGNTSPDINPVNVFAQEGNYPVKLTITDQFGCSDSVTSYVDVVKTASRFLMSDSFSNCPPLVVNFTNISKGYLHSQWDFGDSSQSTLTNPSHIYTVPGTYFAKLIVRNNGGCTDSLTKTIIVKGPNGVLTYSPLKICSPGKVIFTANVQTAVKFIWDYQEGNPDSSRQNVSSHIYNTPGQYLPRMVVEDGSGCRFAISGKDTISVNSIQTKIVADNFTLCDSGIVHFSDSTISALGVTGYNWSFGDGSTSSDSSVQHIFSQPGIYNVNLQVSGPNGCSDTASQIVKVVKSPVVSIIANSKICLNDSVAFTAQAAADTSSVNTYIWNFGNGQTSTLPVPPLQSFSTPGSDTVFLTYSNSSGCASTVSKPVIINPVPQLSVSSDISICTGNSAALSVSGAVSYFWQLPNNSLSCTDCASPVANPANDITYMVKGTNAEGCSSVDSISVKVFKRFQISVSKDTSVCEGSSVQLAANGAPNFTWIPAAGLSSSSIFNPVASPNVTTTYQVIGYDTLQCRNDTGLVRVVVYSNPIVNLGPDKIVPGGSSIVLNPVTSNDVISYHWLPSTSALSCITCANPQFIAKDDVTYKLVIFNDHCSASASINIKVTCNNVKIVVPNAFSPNGDGINDVFFPTGNGAISIKQLMIYNRWGQQLFGLSNVPGNNPTYGWNGTSNGKPVETGVYYYYMEIVCGNEQTIKYTGNVTLLR